MHWLALLLAALFALGGLGCLFLVLVGLPGTWIMLGLAIGVELLEAVVLPETAGPRIGWSAIGVAALLALAGEVVETLAGAAGTRAGGGSTRGMIGAIIGGIAGGILFTPLIPIPIVGTLIGALIGTFAGALIGEQSAETPPDLADNVRAATGATIGRLAGTMGKTIFAVIAWTILVIASFT